MTLRLYSDLASWWPIFSHPDDYEEEAELYVETIRSLSRHEVRRVLELGSGGGNNASHMKRHFELTLVDASPSMLEVSRALNPECEHLEGDMRTLRLERAFDAVMIQDAVMYMTTEDDLAAAISTAAAHLAEGGVALFVPDNTTENYREETSHGGHDGDGRAIRYLEWRHRPSGNTFNATMAYILCQGDDVHVEFDSHTMGLFSRDTWKRLISAAGLDPQVLPYPHSEFDEPREMFGGIKA